MLYWTVKFPENLYDLQTIDLLINTLYLVTLSSIVLIIFSLVSNYGNRVSKNKTFSLISILAGTKIKTFESFFNNYPIIRTMPNLAASEGSSITALYGNSFVNNNLKILTEEIFSKIGDHFWIKNENDMDIITSISGSGPAYYFYLTECLSTIAIEMGLNVKDIDKFIKMVAKGSSDLMLSSDKSVSDLRENVTSKGGTTEAAFAVLDDSEKTFYNLLRTAIKNAIKRSKELSD